MLENSFFMTQLMGTRKKTFYQAFPVTMESCGTLFLLWNCDNVFTCSRRFKTEEELYPDVHVDSKDSSTKGIYADDALEENVAKSVIDLAHLASKGSCTYFSTPYFEMEVFKTSNLRSKYENPDKTSEKEENKSHGESKENFDILQDTSILYYRVQKRTKETKFKSSSSEKSCNREVKSSELICSVCKQKPGRWAFSKFEKNGAGNKTCNSCKDSSKPVSRSVSLRNDSVISTTKKVTTFKTPNGNMRSNRTIKTDNETKKIKVSKEMKKTTLLCVVEIIKKNPGKTSEEIIKILHGQGYACDSSQLNTLLHSKKNGLFFAITVIDGKKERRWYAVGHKFKKMR